MIGGVGEKKTLRLVAQYGDACNIFARLGNDEIKRKLDVLREHCQSVKRPYEDIEKTTLDNFRLTRDGRDGSLSPSAAIDLFGSLAELGIDQVIFSLHNVTDIEPFDVLAQIMPQIEKINVAGR
jgi:hypothetical protein